MIEGKKSVLLVGQRFVLGADLSFELWRHWYSH